MKRSRELTFYARLCGGIALVGMISNAEAIWQATFVIVGVVFAVGGVVLKEFGR